MTAPKVRNIHRLPDFKLVHKRPEYPLEPKEPILSYNSLLRKVHWLTIASNCKGCCKPTFLFHPYQTSIQPVHLALMKFDLALKA